MKYISSCWEDQRLSAEGKIVSKYCHISKTRRRGSINPTCIMVGVWLSLYVRGLTLIRHDYFGRKLRSHESLWYHLPRNIRKLKQRRPRATRTAKKTIDLFSKTITLHVQHTFLYISLPSLHDYDVVKMLNFTFYVGSENKTTIFFFLLWT